MISSFYPKLGMIWAAEVEASHAQRFYDILIAKNIIFQLQKPYNSIFDPWLFYTFDNLIVTQQIPVECCKYIHKMLYIPHCCADLRQIHVNSEFLSLTKGSEKAVFRIIGSPKSIERYVTELLIWDSDDDNQPCSPLVLPENVHPSRYTHIVQVIYSPHEGIFRWGLISKEKAIEYQLLSTTLLGTIERIENSLTIPPICRAYYKIQEILCHHFPLWEWPLPDYSQSYSVDIGSSPGGWTQFLMNYSRYILSIDPGKMDSRLLSVLNREGKKCMKHVPYLAESAECRQELIQLCCEEVTSSNNICRVVRPITICVCDVNFEPHLAADMLAKSIVPFMIEGSLLSSLHSPLASSCEPLHLLYSYLIITLKLQKNPSERIIQKSYNNVRRILSDAFLSYNNNDPLEDSAKVWRSCEFKMIYLNANSKNERTVVCRITHHREDVI